MEIRALIVDDEERGIIALKELIQKFCTDVVVAGTATNIDSAARLINDIQPDVVFLDIEMPGGNGFQLLEKFDDVWFEVVFVTAFHEYAIKAIKCSALDYLLKPVKISDLQQAVEKVKKKKLQDASVSQKIKYDFLKTVLNDPNPFKKLILSTLDGFSLIKIEDVIYCKADDSYTHFYLAGNKHYLVSKNLKEFEDMLIPHHFYRIHKSYLINLNHIDKVTKAGVSVLMSNNEELPISFRRKDEFISIIKAFG